MKAIIKKKATKKASKKALSPVRLGNKVFCRAVTHYYTGRIVHLTNDEIVLEDAAWIADTGRFSEALRSGFFQEIEPYPDGMLVSIMRGAICDVCDWPHDLPRLVK